MKIHWVLSFRFTSASAFCFLYCSCSKCGAVLDAAVDDLLGSGLFEILVMEGNTISLISGIIIVVLIISAAVTYLLRKLCCDSAHGKIFQRTLDLIIDN